MILIYSKDRIKCTASLIFIYPLYFPGYIFLKEHLRFFRNHLLLYPTIYTLNCLLFNILNHKTYTLHLSWSTFSLRPRAAATKNKMRMAEKAFIYLIQVKNIPRTGARLQILLATLMGMKISYLVKEFTLISFIGGMSVPDDRKESKE